MSQWRPVGGQIRPGATLRQSGSGPSRPRRRTGGQPPKGTNNSAKRGSRGPFGWNKWQTGAGVLGALLAAFVLLVIVVAAQLPDPSNVQVHAGEVKLFDRTGTKLVADVSGGANRVQVPLNQISPNLQHATVAAEDRHFYENRLIGVDFGRLVKAMTVDLISRQAVQGASTITQQLAKNELLSSDRTITRKFKEAILATEIEQRFSKDDILSLYLNSIFYGHHAYGAQAAAQVYFGKDAKDLTIGQASFLAGLPQAPSLYDPYTNYQGAKDRQFYVLGQMVRDGYIKQSDADASIAEDLRPQLKSGNLQAATGPAPHFVEYVLGQLDAQYGAAAIRAGGVQVTTSIDLDVQNAANTAIQNGVGKLGHGVNNAAMLVTDPKTGQILAMVGSADFNNVGIAGQVNITNTGRQPGSSFKPYVYLTGLNNHKLDTTTVLKDAPGAVPGTVNDFDNRFLGTMRMRTALVKSRNVPAEQAMMISGPTDVVAMAHLVGISSPLEPNLATAIGGLHTGITMIDHSIGYGVLATEGIKHDAVSLLKVQASDGRDITIAPPAGQKVVEQGPAFIVDDILKGYNKEWSLGFDRPLAAKSGTTNIGSNTGDGWLMSYNPAVVIATWAGHTSNNPTEGNATRGFFGVNLATPIVDPFLKLLPGRWTKDVDFTKPAGISTANCGSTRLSVADPGPDYILQGTTPNCTPPPPPPTEAASPVPTESPSPSPSPSGPPSPIIVFPTPSAKASPSVKPIP
jgi:membrane peptidoglycan carboxypeptidase